MTTSVRLWVSPAPLPDSFPSSGAVNRRGRTVLPNRAHRPGPRDLLPWSSGDQRSTVPKTTPRLRPVTRSSETSLLCLNFYSTGPGTPPYTPSLLMILSRKRCKKGFRSRNKNTPVLSPGVVSHRFLRLLSLPVCHSSACVLCPEVRRSAGTRHTDAWDSGRGLALRGPPRTVTSGVEQPDLVHFQERYVCLRHEFQGREEK